MLVLTIGGAILGYGAMAGATHALLSRIWKPVKAASESWMDEEIAERRNVDREFTRCLGATFWPAALVVVCLIGAAAYSNKWTARALDARKPQAGLPGGPAENGGGW